ncbi:hypothetical protein DV714_17155 [Parageobacillus thermoglucosidasius]|nr:hypothetical protein DV714_17155 [Parageobacillus thermoglucosidasius]
MAFATYLNEKRKIEEIGTHEERFPAHAYRAAIKVVKIHKMKKTPKLYRGVSGESMDMPKNVLCDSIKRISSKMESIQTVQE